MKKVTKAIIMVAGYGTRFLPATLCTPKELFPIVDKPILFYHLKECVQSGITDVCLISSKEKKSIEDLIYPNKKLLEKLKQTDKLDYYLHEYYEIVSKLHFTVVYPQKMIGTAYSLLQVKDWTKGEPFVLFYGDDLIESKVPASKQLVDVYEQTEKSVCILQKVKKADIHKYGVASLEKISGKEYYNMTAIIEKPKTEEAPSLYASVGRFVLTSEIFAELENLEPINGEYYVSSGINKLAKKGRVNAKILDGKYHDCGNKLEFAKTMTDYMLKSAEFGDEYKTYIKEIAKKL